MLSIIILMVSYSVYLVLPDNNKSNFIKFKKSQFAETKLKRSVDYMTLFKTFTIMNYRKSVFKRSLNLSTQYQQYSFMYLNQWLNSHLHFHRKVSLFFQKKNYFKYKDLVNDRDKWMPCHTQQATLTHEWTMYNEESPIYVRITLFFIFFKLKLFVTYRLLKHFHFKRYFHTDINKELHHKW